MRTIDEIQQQIERRPDDDDGDDYRHNQDIAYDEGSEAGFRRGLKLVRDGQTSADILAYTQADVSGYQPHGNDDEDAWQSGYSTALYWCAEQFDWDAEGRPLFRPGNALGAPADPSFTSSPTSASASAASGAAG